MPKAPPVFGPKSDYIWFPDDLMFPQDIPASAVPLTLVCGSPASGKSTWVAHNAKPGDIVIDLDDIIRGMGFTPRTGDRAARYKGLEERNTKLRGLAHAHAGAAWFITGAPKAETRERWCQMLRPMRTVIVMAAEDVCVSRVAIDQHRRATAMDQLDAIRRWFRSYTPRGGETIIGEQASRKPVEQRQFEAVGR